MKTTMPEPSHRVLLEYPFRGSTLRIVYASITRLGGDVLVSSDDVNLSMGGGVSRALALRGGERVVMQARQAAPIRLGEVAATTAGRLSARKIFHAAVLDGERRSATTVELVRNVTRRCLTMCDELHYSSIVFPALATGTAGLAPEESALAMASEAVAFLSRLTGVKLVVIALLPQTRSDSEEARRFYNQVVEVLAMSSPGA